MATDLKLLLENRPGRLADLGEATGKAGVNIYGVCGIPCEGHGEVHLLAANVAETRKVIAAAGLEVAEEREVLLIDVEDRPRRSRVGWCGCEAHWARLISSRG